MSNYLKLFKTESEFIRCLDAKINGDNNVMKFPNVSVIGEEDNNGNFSASEIHYIKDLNKAEDIYDKIDGYWINPTNIIIESGSYDIDALNGHVDSGPSFKAARFQPFDWYDKDSRTTYYAYISTDAYANLVETTGNINLFDVDVVKEKLLKGSNGNNPYNNFLSEYNKYDSSPSYSGKILYVTDTLDSNPELYEKLFKITEQNKLVFGDIELCRFYGTSFNTYHSTQSFNGKIEGYDVESSSGSGSGDGN